MPSDISPDVYGEFDTAWCPGCGNHQLLKGLKQGLAEAGLAPHQVCIVSGIGQAAKTPHYLHCNGFNGLHGRSLPAAQAVKLAQPGLTVICESGDGCQYGEGGNHFLAAVRRNVNLTMLTHDNQIYGLTKGQASPMTSEGQKTKAQPFGSPSVAFNPLIVAIGHRVSLVARSFSGDPDHVAAMVQEGINADGFALIDIMQPCVSFNKVNTFKWYKERCTPVGDDYDPTDHAAAMAKAMEFGDTIPTGVLWRGDRPSFESHLPTVGEPLAARTRDAAKLDEVQRSFI